jgi:hypothetical protein
MPVPFISLSMVSEKLRPKFEEIFYVFHNTLCHSVFIMSSQVSVDKFVTTVDMSAFVDSILTCLAVRLLEKD